MLSFAIYRLLVNQHQLILEIEPKAWNKTPNRIKKNILFIWNANHAALISGFKWRHCDHLCELR